MTSTQTDLKVQLTFYVADEVDDETGETLTWQVATTETATLVARTEDRLTLRTTETLTEKSYEWDAYKYDGEWAYGSSADKLGVSL